MARAGNSSLHRKWLQGGERNFDLYLSCYGDRPQEYAADAEYLREMKSTKWPAWYDHIAAERDLVAKYDAVWFPDDDLLVDTAGINRVFDLFAGFDLALAQPALSHDSYCSHPILLRDPTYIIRYTNFVEVMGPVFSREALAVLHPTFSQSRTGWGLDYLWPSLLSERGMGGKIGVIDAVSMTHTRPVGGGDIYQGQVDSGTADLARLRELYPDARIDSRSQRDNLSIYGGVRTSSFCEGFLARIRARYATYLVKRAVKRIPKYGA
jgi:Protein of unknown function (DUF707)